MRKAAVALVGWDGEAGDEIADHLERRGFELKRLRGAGEAMARLEGHAVHVVLFGPHVSSTEALGAIRRAKLPGDPFYVIAVRGVDMVAKVVALETGAADIVDGDIAPRELAARVGRLAARHGARVGALLMLENSTVDLHAALVMHRDGREEQLSPGQVTLLRLFAERPNTVLTRELIIEVAPAEDSDAFDRSIDSRIARLRRKLDTEAIVTIRGSGYRFDPPRHASSRP